jgi:hypothetical protein
VPCELVSRRSDSAWTARRPHLNQPPTPVNLDTQTVPVSFGTNSKTIDRTLEQRLQQRRQPIPGLALRFNSLHKNTILRGRARTDY